MLMFIVRVKDGRSTYDYEYSNLKHAMEHMEWEKSGVLIEYNSKDGYKEGRIIDRGELSTDYVMVDGEVRYIEDGKLSDACEYLEVN